MSRFLRFRQKITKAFLFGALGLTTIAMNGCDSIYWDEQESLAQVQAKGEIVVLTTQSPLIYSKPKRGDAFGIDHDLIQNFAHRYNIKIKYVVLPDEDSVMRALLKGEGDIAAARLRTPHNNQGFLAGPAYEETYLSLYCHKKSQVLNIKDLNGKKIAILNKDNYLGLSQRLNQLSPAVQVEVLENIKTQELISLTSQNKYDCAIAENFSGDFYSRYHGQVEKIAALTEPYSLSWLVTPNNPDLLSLMQAWFQQASRDDEVMLVLDRYKTYLSQLDKRDISRFFKKIRTTLPTYKQAFKNAGDEHRLPWQLIASVAYQESHWNPDARSFTGVRGLMQLTTETADHVGIEDRTDPLQSIWGGSKYLRYLLDKTPKHLNHKDRLALALAAYNVGLAHLKDAQKLAEKMGRNPNSWRHLREVLPLLADPDYADELEYGPARGYETVDFVERVKSFYNLMNSAS
ncbi:membrane-bound lytic murein transglycosylase MltF [Bdellovibrio sp. 22V]|uniref:membrane-bound lytic murein transglycosylase MltF n=1 Tax=Bdellovibrio TaxID=958 RepID=UPI002542B875|nr:membrane-bound lytic murein transglycosylase MltF [Bdellovibrio sp. 22V]WII72415.1 membrane-bound lytic murein transglycosylase MltF [Bdellovibrio sp. 22V]